LVGFASGSGAERSGFREDR